jgi:dihydroorotate dehydrogenase (NAD+) catalytic subunit
MLKVKIRDIEFKSPIIASSGTYGYGYEVDDFVDLSKIGCIITKSITKEPRKGNPSPRIHESRSGMINAIGLANVGVKEFCKNKLSKLNSIDTRFIISVAGTTIEEYIQVVNKIEKSEGLHVGYEINVSCPNIKKGGMEFGLNKDATYELTSKLRNITDKLLIIKLSPNVTNITEIAESAELGGADAISAINTFIGLAIDHKTGKMLLSTTFGGVSGPAIKPLALAKIHSIYKKIKIPIIGIGGISSFEDIIQFLRVGSSMVQIGTLNYRDPSIISLFYNDLKVFLENKKISHICDLVGDYIEH